MLDSQSHMDAKETYMRNILIFDLDETVIDSRHRTPNNPDGTLNLKAYIENHTPENVAKDTLLPLAAYIKIRHSMGDYIIVCTARDMKQCDYEFLARNGINYHKIMSRDTVKHPSHYRMKDGEYKARWIIPYLNLKQFRGHPVIMFDDASPVKSTLRAKGVRVMCAHKVNKRLTGARI